MEKKKIVIKRSVETVEEFDALLEHLKVQSPAKYKINMESGEFDRFRKTLKGNKEEPKKEEKAKKEEPKVVEEKEPKKAKK